jgi:prepilin-type N-terminal cleavage/methylation domain-containing protein
MNMNRHTFYREVGRAVPSTPSVSCVFQFCGALRTQRPARGFTLIELLISVMIFGIVLIAINTVFYSALRLRNRTAALIDSSQNLEQALAFLRKDLKSVVPPGGVMAQWFKVGPVSPQGMANSSTGTTAGNSVSRGGVTTTGVSAALQTGSTGGAMQSPGIQFYTTTGAINEYEPWGDLQRVTYQLQPAADHRAFGKDLVRSVNRNLLATTTEDPIEQRLLSNIDTMDFECYTGIQWQTTWDTTLTDTGLPTAVRVRIVFATEYPGDARNRQPLEMIVPLIVQTMTNQTSTTSSTGGTL